MTAPMIKRGTARRLGLRPPPFRLSIRVPPLSDEQFEEFVKRWKQRVESNRCSRERPCAKSNVLHIDLWGECFSLES